MVAPAGALPSAPHPATSIAAASALSAGTIVPIAGSPGWGPSAATNTSMQLSQFARAGTTLYVADGGWSVVRSIDLTTGTQRVVVGTGAYGTSGDGGPATSATLTSVTAMAADDAGALYLATVVPPPGVSGVFNVTATRVRRVAPDGVITTVPGVPPGIVVAAMVVAPDGALLLGDLGGHVWRLTGGTAEIIAGAGVGDIPLNMADGHPALTVGLNAVRGLVITPDGQVALTTDSWLLRIDAAGIVHTVAPTEGTLGVKADGNFLVTNNGIVTLVRPDGTTTRLFGCACPYPESADAFPGSGGHRVLEAIADAEDRVLMISSDDSGVYFSYVTRSEPDGSFSTVAGTNTGGGSGGPAGLSQFLANDVQAMPDGSVALLAGTELWRISRDGIATIVVPHDVLAPPELGTAASPFHGGLTMDANGTLYAFVRGVVRRIDTAGHVTTVAGSGSLEMSGDGGPAIAAGLGRVSDIAAGAPGELFISDGYDGVIRHVTPDGTITTLAGSRRDQSAASVAQTGDGGPATAATLAGPTGLTVDHAGNLYLIDASWFDGTVEHPGAIRRITPGGVITRVMSGTLSDPLVAITVDSADNLVIATGTRPTIDGPVFPCVCQVLRRNVAGMVEVLAGSSVPQVPSSTGDGGPALVATVHPTAISLDSSNNLFLLDANGTRVREVVAVGAPNAAPPATPVVATAPFTG